MSKFFESVCVGVDMNKNDDNSKVNFYHFATQQEADGFRDLVETTWKDCAITSVFGSTEEPDSKFRNGVHSPL